ncbi:MAG: hypothetical protein HYX89_05095 [Chloroflexi bacterium]|nr:hypothetical protein [Chloroflexota bacterium]
MAMAVSVKTVQVLSPIGEVEAVHYPIAPRLEGLSGKRVAFMWNHKTNGDALLNGVREEFEQRYGLAKVLVRSKPNSALPADPGLLQELVQRSDAVVYALGD